MSLIASLAYPTMFAINVLMDISARVLQLARSVHLLVPIALLVVLVHNANHPSTQLLLPMALATSATSPIAQVVELIPQFVVNVLLHTH